MGGCNSKRSAKSELQQRIHGGVDLARPAQNGLDEGFIIESSKGYDEEAVRVLKNDFATKTQTFILDNIIMCTMFFECYESEITKPAISTKMEKLNATLIKEQSKQCMKPDAIFEIVNRHVLFRPHHGPKKFKSEPLVAQRMFVVYDNIEVMDKSDNSEHYSGIDKPSYRVYMEESQRKGFVKLRQVEYLKPKGFRNMDDSGIGNDTSSSSVSSCEQQQENSKETVGNSSEPMPSSSSCNYYEDSSDSYDYTTITQLKTPQPLNSMPVGSERSNSLPSDCFKPFRVKNYKDLDELLEMDDDTESELFRTISYISSSGFMNHFKNIVFPISLGKALGFVEKEIREAASIPGTVFCQSRDNLGNKVDFEVIPAARIQWPADMVFEWRQRDDRPTIVDPRTTRRYQWPTPVMIKRIEKLPCVVIPRGYMAKRGENADYGIEWEVAFPKVERYLETRMSHAQMRCYLIILSLYKTFIEPKTNKCGLLPEHIRTLMYWECEKNYLNWTENRLGHKILAILRNLYRHLGKSHLPDYFIRQKNCFENIPGKYLRAAQRAILYILESPLMHFITALRNLRYTTADYYPALDFKKLHEILTVENGLKTVNPHAATAAADDDVTAERGFGRKRTLDPELEWRSRKRELVRRKTKRLDETCESKKTRPEKKANHEERRASDSSIDLEFQLEPNLDVCKQISILTFFIELHIEIANKSLQYATPNQAQLYLKQSLYFTRILEGIPSCLPDARKYQEFIKQLDEEVAKKKAACDPTAPSTPKRNSVHYFSTDHPTNLASGGSQISSPKANEIRKLNHTPSQKGVLRVDVHENKENARYEKRGGDRRKTIQFNPEVQSTRI